MSLETTLLTSLRSDSALADILSTLPDVTDADGLEVPAVAHSLAPAGVVEPYVLIHTGAEEPEYTFGNNESYSDCILQIIAYTQDSEDGSASEIADSIQSRIRALLHNQSLSIDGRRLMCGRRLGKTHYGFEVINSQNEAVFMSGYQWLFMTAPA